MQSQLKIKIPIKSSMTRLCVHGIPRMDCVYCRKLNDILNQNTITHRKLMRLITAISHNSTSNITRRLNQLIEYPRTPIPISNRMRQTVRNLINAPGNRAVRERFENAAMNQIIQVEFNLEGTYSGSNSRSPSTSSSSSSAYSRLGSPRNRRARSITPVSTVRNRSSSPTSNENNMNRFSPPRKKSK